MITQPQMIRAESVMIEKAGKTELITVGAKDSIDEKVEFIMVDPMGRYADVVTSSGETKNIRRYFNLVYLKGDYKEPEEQEQPEMEVKKPEC